VPNSVAVGQTVAEIWRFFQDGGRHLDHLRRAFGGVYHCAKFGWNQYSTGSFDNMQVSIFCELGFKMSIQAPKIGVLVAK